MTKELDLTQPMQTRGGRRVRLLCTDAEGYKPLAGLVNLGAGETSMQWYPDGRALALGTDPFDLVNVPCTYKATYYLNIFDDGYVNAFRSRKEADDIAFYHDRMRQRRRVACLADTCTVTEGEGL